VREGLASNHGGVNVHGLLSDGDWSHIGSHASANLTDNSSALLSAQGQAKRSLEQHLGACMLMLVKQAVRISTTINQHDVADNEGGIELAALNAVEEMVPVALNVGLAGAHVESLVEKGTNREMRDLCEVVSHNGNPILMHRRKKEE
jgi:hypothetical protein